MRKFVIFIASCINPVTLTLYTIALFWLSWALTKLGARFVLQCFKWVNKTLSILIPSLWINITYHSFAAKWRRRFEILCIWFALNVVFNFNSLHPTVLNAITPLKLYQIVIYIFLTLLICGAFLVTYRIIKKSTTLELKESWYYSIRLFFSVFLKTIIKLIPVYAIIVCLSMLYAIYGIVPVEKYVIYKISNDWWDVISQELEDDPIWKEKWTSYYELASVNKPDDTALKYFRATNNWAAELLIFLVGCLTNYFYILTPYVQLLKQSLHELIFKLLQWVLHLLFGSRDLYLLTLLEEFWQFFHELWVYTMYPISGFIILQFGQVLVWLFLWLTVWSVYTLIHAHNEREYMDSMRNYLEKLRKTHLRDPKIKYIGILEKRLEALNKSDTRGFFKRLRERFKRRK